MNEGVLIYLITSITAIFSLLLFEDNRGFIGWVDFITARLLIPLTISYLFTCWPRPPDIQYERLQPKHTSS
jgi:hypothetical protein